ncbi:MAG: FecCD family ABC transporter permease [Acidimicrobiia bacterium]
MIETLGRETPSVATSPTSRLRARTVGLAVTVLVAAALFSILSGPVAISPGGAVAELVDRLPLVDMRSGLSQRDADIVWQIRFPRVVLGALVGAMLAMAGAAYQGVFRNPLVDPYLLGVAAGAGLGATIAFARNAAGGPLLPVAAFVGAVVAVAATYSLGRTVGGRSTVTLVLAGVAVTSFFTAAQTYLQQRSAIELRSLYSWLLGRLSTTGWSEVGVAAPYAMVAGVVLLLHRRLLDVMAVDDGEAASLGVNPSRVRMWVVLAATLGTAAAVAVSGLIAFVGIIVPHGIRLVFGVSYRRVLPLSGLIGAAFLVVADVAARTLVSPAELPIGVVTAFLGAPFFLVVMRANRRLA